MSVDLTEFMEYAAAVTRGQTPEQEPTAIEGRSSRDTEADAAVAAPTGKQPSCSVISLDSRRNLA